MTASTTEHDIRLCLEQGQIDAAFNLLVASYSESLFRSALRITMDEALAEDALQDASIKIWQKLGTFRGESKVSTWAHRIVINESLTSIRRQKRFTQLDGVQAERLTSSGIFNGDAILEELYRAMATLPDKQRITFQLRYFDDLPFKEIANRLDQSEGGLKANYHHAVKKIKIHFETLNLSLSELSIG